MTSIYPVGRAVSLALVAAAGLAFTADGTAQGRGDRLEHHRAACLLTQPNADVEACVEEALAARSAAREGELRDGGTPYQRNALLRCRALPAADQPACEARIRGRGTASGSVEEGGILRELVIREQPAAQVAAPAQAMPPAPAAPAVQPTATHAPATAAPAAADPTADGLSDTIPADPTSPYGPQLPR